MQPHRKFARVDTQELKSQITKKLGHQRAEHYFNSLKKFLSFKLSKDEFDKICMGVMGKENIKLHNFLIQSILSNACLSLGPPSKQTATGNSQTSMVSNGPLGNGIPPANRGRSITSRDRKLTDRPSPLGPHGKASHGHAGEVSNSCDVPRSREQQSALEFVSVGSKVMLEVVSVEDGEEVEQVRSSPACVQSRSPIRAPLGIPKAHTPQPSTSCSSETCYTNGELPDTQSLWKLLEHKFQSEGLNVSMECAHALNSGLNAHLSQLLKSFLDVANARGSGRRIHRANGSVIPSVNGRLNHSFPSESGQFYQASLQDLQEFHSKYYHPSNARIWFYGDDDPKELKDKQETPDPREALKAVPSLSLQDIPKKPIHVPIEVQNTFRDFEECNILRPYMGDTIKEIA